PCKEGAGIEMIRVEKHVHGIAVSSDLGVEHDERLQYLEMRLGRRLIHIYGGQLIAPIDSIVEIYTVLGNSNVIWDEELLRLALGRLDHLDMQMRARLEVARALEDPKAILAGYERITELDLHQVEAVAAIVSPSLKGIAIFDEQGTGKTIMALAAFDRLRKQRVVKHLLVVAPKSVLSAWQSQCVQFLGEGYQVVVVAGAPAQRRRAIWQPHDILLVGYETAVREASLLRMVISIQPSSYMLVIDESYFVKNPATARAQTVAHLRGVCERAVVLCGTPAPNSALDVVNQIDVADGGVAFAGRSIPKDAEAAYLPPASQRGCIA
ncbi:MAG: SNF2-related protein, partial [Acidobacteriota bacterium]|nr:SNF2-related protein [Acidobacteriota bacterium]